MQGEVNRLSNKIYKFTATGKELIAYVNDLSSMAYAKFRIDIATLDDTDSFQNIILEVFRSDNKKTMLNATCLYNVTGQHLYGLTTISLEANSKALYLDLNNGAFDYLTVKVEMLESINFTLLDSMSSVNIQPVLPDTVYKIEGLEATGVINNLQTDVVIYDGSTDTGPNRPCLALDIRNRGESYG